MNVLLFCRVFILSACITHTSTNYKIKCHVHAHGETDNKQGSKQSEPSHLKYCISKNIKRKCVPLSYLSISLFHFFPFSTFSFLKISPSVDDDEVYITGCFVYSYFSNVCSSVWRDVRLQPYLFVSIINLSVCQGDNLIIACNALVYRATWQYDDSCANVYLFCDASRNNTCNYKGCSNTDYIQGYSRQWYI